MFTRSHAGVGAALLAPPHPPEDHAFPWERQGHLGAAPQTGAGWQLGNACLEQEPSIP